MASEISLKYLHPHVKSYITTENYDYDTSVDTEVMFIADVFERGVDNKIQTINTLSEYLFKYGDPNIDKYGQGGYNVEKWLTNGGTACIMRLLPADASFAHAVFNIQYKNQTNGKTVLNNEGDEAKINDVYLRPLISYIMVNNTSETLLNSELTEDRSKYPTTDGYYDNFLFEVYPEGRGEYYNNLGFRIRLNPSYDQAVDFRVYNFEVIKYTTGGTTYDVVEGPFYVTFDPDALDPNSGKSMFIENVINTYSEYVKVKFNTENYVKLATIINGEVDPYRIDVITGQSRITADGTAETFYSTVTNQDEDVHVSLRKYSSNGIALKDNGEYILNIANNDEAMAEIVDIADNARKVIYMNQYYVTKYMRAYYNWLINNRVLINMHKILEGSIQGNVDQMHGLLIDKVANLLYNNITNDTANYTSKITERKASDVGGAWYLEALDNLDPYRKITAPESSDQSVNEKNVYISSDEMTNMITEDGFVVNSKKNLISLYNNFIKYFQFICNYDIYNKRTFIDSKGYTVISKRVYYDEVTTYKSLVNQYDSLNNTFAIIERDNTPNGAILAFDLTNSDNEKLFKVYRNYASKDKTTVLNEYFNPNDTLRNFIISQICFSDTQKVDWILGVNQTPDVFANTGIIGQEITKLGGNGTLNAMGCNCSFAEDGSDNKAHAGTMLSNLYVNNPIDNSFSQVSVTPAFFYFDDTSKTETIDGYIRPIFDTRYFNSDGKEDLNGDYIKVYDANGEENLMLWKSISVTVSNCDEINKFLSANESSINSSNPLRANLEYNSHYNMCGAYKYEVTSREFKEKVFKMPTKDEIRSILNNSNASLTNYDELLSSCAGPTNLHAERIVRMYAYNIADPTIKRREILSHIFAGVGSGDLSLGTLDMTYNLTYSYIYYILLGDVFSGTKEDRKSGNSVIDGNLSHWKFRFFVDRNATDEVPLLGDNGRNATLFGVELPNNILTNEKEFSEAFNDSNITTDYAYYEFSFENLFKLLYEKYRNQNKNIENLISTYNISNPNDASKVVERKAMQLIKDYYSFLKPIASLYGINIKHPVGGNADIKYLKLSSLGSTKYIVNTKPEFNAVFDEYSNSRMITRAYNKVYSYASIISKELDGKGKEEILDINNLKPSNIDSSDYSLTTILNLIIAGFEALVNNQGSITDYNNYSSLKYMIRTINNSLDLRSTYLTLLSIHKNKILDTSTELAKLNSSVILGSETLEKLFNYMDIIVSESNYLINIIKTILNKTYTIKNLISLDRLDNNQPYAYYFSNNKDNGSETNQRDGIDPLGILNNISTYGSANETNFYGVLPYLEKMIIDITGENHYGTAVDPIYGGQPLVDIYQDIVDGYTNEGLNQKTYELIYDILDESLSNLSNIHRIIQAFINEKYITEIVSNLLGAVDIDNTIINYKGKNFNINTLFDYYNQDLDPDLTQNIVLELILENIEFNKNEFLPPYEIDQNDPILAYPYFSIQDIIDGISTAKKNKKIVKNNIVKQDHVLSTLNTLCYDNLVQDISMPIGLAEGSDGNFEYDDSTNAAIVARWHRINDIRIKAYKGTWNDEVLNKDVYEFDYVFDANYPDAVKNAIVTLARDERNDFFFFGDTKIQNTITDCLNWKQSYTTQTYFMSLIAQSQVWYDEYTSKNIELTSTYLLADMLMRHITSYGVHYPMAGSRRGVVGGFITNNWYPNENQKEELYKNKINYIERDVTTIRIGAQNTNYPSGPLGSINNMLVVLKIKRAVEKIAKTYQFEFNTDETRQKMENEINRYLSHWTTNGACTEARSNVYASDYDIINKIARVDITLKFTGVIERIVININCPASV